MAGRLGGRCKQVVEDLKEKRRHWNLKEKALGRTLWRTPFRRGYGPVIRETKEISANECNKLKQSHYSP
jgi:hypothetical protein